MDDVRSEDRTELSRRRFLGGALGATAVRAARWRAGPAAQAKPTITYWNGLTGADGKVMDELIDQFTSETGHQDRAAAHPLGRPLREAPGLGAGRRRARTSA